MKAVAEARKMDKGEGQGPEGSSLARRKLGQLWSPVGGKFRELRTFFSEVKSELKKVTWPSKKEVYATTLVVIATTVLFGFYLWLLDVGLSWLFQHTIGTV
jgi:preprotein translocase subunit SecE